MPLATFNNLPAAKKQIIINALLNEFSQHPLSEAKVSRVIVDAGISRGAFYKYFVNIQDAYDYTYQETIKIVHAPLRFSISAINQMTPEKYVNNLREFLVFARETQYGQFIINYLFCTSLKDRPLPHYENECESPISWAVRNMCHAAVYDIVIGKKSQEETLNQLFQILQILMKK